MKNTTTQIPEDFKSKNYAKYELLALKSRAKQNSLMFGVTASAVIGVITSSLLVFLIFVVLLSLISYLFAHKRPKENILFLDAEHTKRYLQKKIRYCKSQETCKSLAAIVEEAEYIQTILFASYKRCHT